MSSLGLTNNEIQMLEVQIQKLIECNPLTENEIKNLCDKVF